MTITPPCVPLPEAPSPWRIGGRGLPTLPGQTLLEALEAAGVAWPSHCRVGACGTCRCRVVSGKVLERTESAYLLSNDEIAAGVVLACQSEARGEVRITAAEALPRCEATVEAVRFLTPSVRELVLRPEATIDYRAGQVALLHLPVAEGQPAVVRPYSFATVPAADGLLRFTIRLHPGGAFSEALARRMTPGDRLVLEGPTGRFALPDGAGPLLVVGGGTGLPPLLALLESAMAEGQDAREVRVLLVTRDPSRHFAASRLAALASGWRGGLRIETLSPEASAGDGDVETGPLARSLARLPTLLEGLRANEASAAVCGSPAFVDAVAAQLLLAGLPPSRLALDRFSPAMTPAAMPPSAPAADAGAPEATGGAPSPWAMLKFSLFHAIGLSAVIAIVAGGAWSGWGLLAIVAAYVLGDALLGDDLSVPAYRHTVALTALLWSALPLVVLIVFAAVWRVSPGDPLGFGAAVQVLTGADVLAARESSGAGSLIAVWALTGLMIGMVATVPAHELVHRTWDRLSMAVGRALLAFSFDTSFAIEHVHGHHRAVATPDDPASAPRGRSVYAHILHSTGYGNLSAWRIEVARLAKRGLGPWSAHNAVLRGWAGSVLLLAAAAAMAGIVGVLFFAACALWGKALLEIVNYMEHYGLARDPVTPVQPRHSWNTNRRVSSWSMFNLTRHSHHHAQGELPFHALTPMPGAPMMPAGYLTTILLTLVPPLWRRLMAPRLAEWDARFATPVERALARVHAEG